MQRSARRAIVGCGVALWACGEPTPPPAELVPSWAPSADPQHVQITAPEQGVPLALQFVGMNALYRRYFSDEALVGPLSKALLPCIKGRATLSMSYDEPTRVGHVALVVPANQLICRATPSGDGFDMSALTPVTQALAAYRNGMGATKDMRIYSFRTALHVEDGFGAVTLWLDGQDPIDGTAFGRCVGLDGFERCVTDKAPDGITVVDPVEPKLRRRLADLVGPVSP